MDLNNHDTGLKKEKWHKAIENRFSKTELALHQLKLDCTADHIHDFRVEIKKMKALIHLLNYSSGDSSIVNFPKPLNKLYQSLGSLREWQIQKENIMKAADELHYTEHLAYGHKINRETDKCKHRVMKLISGLQDLKKNWDHIKKNSSEEISLASIDGFIQTKINEVHLILESGNEDDESMHEMRKKIKDVQYMLSGPGKTMENETFSSRLESVQQVSGQLGDYHDMCISLLMLKMELERIRKERSEKKLLRKIRDRWRAEKVTLRRETLQSTQALIQRHFPEFG